MRKTTTNRVHHVGGILVVLAASMTSACVPQAPAPALPAGVGIQWVRDTGGTVSENGTYQEGYSRFTLLDGAVDGPTPVPTPFTPLVPTAGAAYGSFGLPIFPDGTARFPWNGFAGEGIVTTTTVAGTTTTFEVTAPSGTCRFSNFSTTFATPRTTAAIPSPDGTKLAVYTRLTDPDANATDTTVAVHTLDANCTRRSSASYRRSSSAGTVTGEIIVSPLTVWSPDSSAILFPVQGATAAAGTRVMRLDAAVGSTPSVVVDDGRSTIMPLGWSPAGRVLVSRSSVSTATPPVRSTSLETMDATGGHSIVFDVQTGTTPSTRPEFHVGYFIPGTTQIAYSGGTRTATAPDGRIVARPEFRIYDDATGADSPIPSTDGPLMWHATPAGDMLNAELLERFVH